MATVAPLQRLFDLLRASDTSKREGTTGLMGWQGNSTAPVVVKDLVEQMGPHIHDLSTHRSAWRNILVEKMNAVHHDAGDDSYYKHEVAAFDRLFEALTGLKETSLLTDDVVATVDPIADALITAFEEAALANYASMLRSGARITVGIRENEAYKAARAELLAFSSGQAVADSAFAIVQHMIQTDLPGFGILVRNGRADEDFGWFCNITTPDFKGGFTRKGEPTPPGSYRGYAETAAKAMVEAYRLAIKDQQYPFKADQ
ncbi:hypothetical protein STRZYGA_00250 [Brevundimonas phage vB_BpoS-Strzyga]|nr:hypothetical protein STRZYGA_00250 [Brevundimonas phage vB_BpoS-Strzyga]